MVAHESCTCTCGFCADGNCKVVFESDMDLYWCMRHLLCPPAKLYSQTSRNLFPPRYCLSSHSSFINGCLLLSLPSVCSCLDGRCSAATPCFFARTSTIFQCPKSALFSDTDQITFEQCVNEDVTASAYAIDPLVEGRPTITLHGVPPPKRTKRIWKRMTKSKREFSARLLELAPDTFQHHQLETVQREQLPIQVRSINKHNNIVAAWVDYPENASIIDPQEQQSDYYDRLVFHFHIPRSFFSTNQFAAFLFSVSFLQNQSSVFRHDRLLLEFRGGQTLVRFTYLYYS